MGCVWLIKHSLFLFCCEVNCWLLVGVLNILPCHEQNCKQAYIPSQTPENDLFLYFLYRHNEAYTWTNPTCCVHNVIIGKLWLEQYGTVEIVNHR